jgi:hypothetical protein
VNQARAVHRAVLWSKSGVEGKNVLNQARVTRSTGPFILRLASGKRDLVSHPDMSFPSSRFLRAGALLAINLLFLMVWGFTGISKLFEGMPPWFDGKFGKTFLASFPGLTATFWLLAICEVAAFGLTVVALVRGEFLERCPPQFLSAALVWSLFVFGQLGLGQWLTADFNATQQLFMYFCGTLIALSFVAPSLQAGSRKEV